MELQITDDPSASSDSRTPSTKGHHEGDLTLTLILTLAWFIRVKRQVWAPHKLPEVLIVPDAF